MRNALYATKPGRDELLVGSVPFNALDFDTQLYELRAEAEERVRGAACERLAVGGWRYRSFRT